MSDEQLEVVVAVFEDEGATENALAVLKEDERNKQIEVEEVATIWKDVEGRLHLKETADRSTGEGIWAGALVGGVVGLLAGPAGVVVGSGAGALVGGLAASGDAGIRDDDLERLGEGLEPASSAIVVVVEKPWVAAVERALADSADEVTTAPLSEEVVARLR
jgi:uncharacterized membrane protein